MRELIVVGVGPGASNQMTGAAVEALRSAGCVVAAPRHLSLCEGHPNVVALGDFGTTFARMEAERGSVAVLVSDDPGLYSLLPMLKRRFPDTPLRVLPGVSSLQCLCAVAGETWQDAVILSGHGRPLSAARFLNTVERNRLTLLLCGEERSPRWACTSLAGAVGDLGGRVEIVVGERLSYPDATGFGERVTRGVPSELKDRDFDPLSVLLARNLEPWTPPSGRPTDEDFARGDGVPMTREEVRSLILDRLRLTPGGVFWDVGAGTGSVSVAVALACPDSVVHSIECDPDALALLERNRAKFHLHNMTVHPGRALSVMGDLPGPERVFIGGSGGELAGILAALAARDTPLRVVVSAVTLGTLSEAVMILSGDPWRDLEAAQVSVAVSRPLPKGGRGRGLLMAARNPVTLLCANIREVKG